MTYLICYVINLSSVGDTVAMHIKNMQLVATSKQNAYSKTLEFFKEAKEEFNEHFISAAILNIIEL